MKGIRNDKYKNNAEDRRRDEEMLRLYMEDGFTLQQIGDVYGVTRERAYLALLLELHSKIMKDKLKSQSGGNTRSECIS